MIAGREKPVAIVLVLVTVVAASLAASPPRRGEPIVDEQTARHVLNRVTFGPRPDDFETVRRNGVTEYLDAQLHPERIPDDRLVTRLSRFTTLELTTVEIMQAYARPLAEQRRTRRQARGTAESAAPSGMNRQVQRDANRPFEELAQQKVLRAVYSERQLQEVLTDFWFNHFNVDARKGLDRFLLTEYEREAIRPHVLGRFRALLGATAQSPAMLFYLDNWMSTRPMQRPNGGGGLNENYGRELLELHTLGADGGYSQKDVTEVARAFTGWTIDRPRQGNATFRFAPRLHDEGDKAVLGHHLRSGGIRDGEQVLDILARHPATARFIAMKLARRFVSDEPPPALVNRAADRFTATDGDLREVVRSILTSPEFLAPEAYRAKTRTPFEFVIAALRATAADIVDAAPVVRHLRELGMALYQCQPPTGYSDTGDAWTNTGALVARMNFAQALADRPREVGATSVGAVNAQVVGTLSGTTAATIARAESVAQALALTLGSPEFQKR